MTNQNDKVNEVEAVEMEEIVPMEEIKVEKPVNNKPAKKLHTIKVKYFDKKCIFVIDKNSITGIMH